MKPTIEAFCIDLVLALVPGIAWLVHFYRKDRYEPEPVRLVASAFLCGAIAVPPCAFLEHHLQIPILPASLPPIAIVLAQAALIVGPLEEGIKTLVLRLVFFPNPEFNEPMDGIIYGSSVGLGFATVETAIYMFWGGARVLPMRAVITTLLHAGCSGIAGYGLGRAKFAHHPTRPLVRGLLTAIALHSTFDVAALAAPFVWGGQGLKVVTVVIALVMIVLLTVLDRDVDEAERSSPFRPRYHRTRHRHHPRAVPAHQAGDRSRGPDI